MKKLAILLILGMSIAFCFAQDLIVPKQGDPIAAFNLTMADDYVFYQSTADESSLFHRIAKKNILVIRKESGSVLSMENSLETDESDRIDDNDKSIELLDLSDFKGLLIGQGNNVYIPTTSTIKYERDGQEEFKRLIEKLGFWNVVDSPRRAHFILQFGFTDRGNDINFVILRTQTSYLEDRMPYTRNELSTLSLGWKDARETSASCITNARLLSSKVVKLVEEIKNDKLDKATKKKWSR